MAVHAAVAVAVVAAVGAAAVDAVAVGAAAVGIVLKTCCFSSPSLSRLKHAALF